MTRRIADLRGENVAHLFRALAAFSPAVDASRWHWPNVVVHSRASPTKLWYAHYDTYPVHHE